MPPTKSFNDLVQNREANDPEFAAVLLREEPITKRGQIHFRPAS